MLYSIPELEWEDFKATSIFGEYEMKAGQYGWYVYLNGNDIDNNKPRHLDYAASLAAANAHHVEQLSKYLKREG